MCEDSAVVASGKSSLLQALLGEMSLLAGSVEMAHISAIAYSQQSTWLRSSSIRANIQQYLPFEALRYRSVVEACALDQDFASFPAGDATLVGPKGLTLSGGTKVS